MSKKRKIAILGSTGSIGRQTLEVVRWMPEQLEVVGLAAGSYSDAFRAQIDEFRPELVAIGRPPEPGSPSLPGWILQGPEGLASVATMPGVDVVMMATVGKAGLGPTLAALKAGRNVALANKEALVMAGDLVTRTARKAGVQILPVDSEHSAIWQCLRGEGDTAEGLPTVRNLILTASGGALRDLRIEDLDRVTPEQVLAHPTWRMGPKVTVDSATLMNKGLEVIEACWLFGAPLEKIRVLLHRESIIHSLVEFLDGSVIAQLGAPDMRIPIQHALCYPDRAAGGAERLDLARVGCLSFGEIDLSRYPCLGLALESARQGASYPAALSAANEIAVDLFLKGKTSFGDISRVVGEVLQRHRSHATDTLEAILHVDEWARREALAVVRNLKEGN